MSLTVSRGTILAYRVFDAGDAISLDVAERRFAETQASHRVELKGQGIAGLVFAVKPLELRLGTRSVALPTTGRNVTATLLARLYDYGAVSILFEIPIEAGTSIDALTPICDEIYESSVLEGIGRAEKAKLVKELGAAVYKPHEWPGVETYTVVLVEKFLDGPSIKDVLSSPALPKLLVGESSAKAFSPEQAADVVKHAHSYFEDDLAVIDWNSALVIEPSGSRLVPDVLEFATSQLLELRYYDGLLDGELSRVYERVGRLRRDPIWRSPYSRLTRDMLRRLVEVTEFTERVDNALKIIGDFYLTRVYEAAITRFRIREWRGSVDEKQALVQRAYGLLKGDVQARRSTLLEVVVILLILFEFIAALRGDH